MPYLGDYLGHLMSEITLARVQADLEAVRIAEFYANHPLLQHLPVPHFRLPTVTLDVPVVIKDMEEAQKGEPPRGGVELSVLGKSFERLLDLHLKRAGIELSDEKKTRVKQTLEQTISSLAQPKYVSISLTHVADELISTTVKALGESKEKGVPLEPAQFTKMSDDLKRATYAEFVNLRQIPPRLHVLVTTAELREAGPQDILMHLNLSISEQGVEWKVVESKGKSSPRLTPE